MNETAEVCRELQWSYIWSSNSWVRYGSRNDRVRCCTNDVTIYLRFNTNIILYDGKIERTWWQCNQRLIVFINDTFCLHFFQVCLNWLLFPVWCTCIVKWQFYLLSPSFCLRFWCNWLLLTFEYPLCKFQVRHSNIKRFHDLLRWCLVK